MNTPARRRLSPWFDFVPHAVAGISVAVGVLVLVGWVFDVEMLKSVLPGLARMKVNSAIGFILAGIALLGTQSGFQNPALRFVAQVCSGVVLLLGLLTLGEYLSGADFGIDQMLVEEHTRFPGDIPGRMSFNAAASLTALGIALLLLRWRTGRAAIAIHTLAMVPVILGGSTLIGYGYDIDEFLRHKLNYSPMSMHTALVSVLLAFGIMNARADYPFRRFVRASNPAGVMARKLLPAAIIFTVATGWLIQQGDDAGYFSETIGLALFTVISISGIGAMILSNAGLVYEAAVQREAIEKALHRSSAEIEDLYDHAPCGYHSLDENGLFTRINHTELEWLGYSRDEVVGKMRLPDLLTPAGVQLFQETFPALKQAGHVHDVELKVKRKDGTLLPVLVSSTAIYDASGRYVSSRSTLFDLTERKKWEHELERQARKDVLTGLNNRRYFFELAEQELARSRRHGEALTLLMMDVDHFKIVNDTYGHDIGDAALKKLSEICMQTFRVIDIVGRIGGEEFAALLPETGTKQALEVAERLRQAVERAGVRLENGSIVRFTISVGVASFGAADDKIAAVLKRADAALYRAKDSGRNRVCVEGSGRGSPHEVQHS